jgi:3-hydroxyisobutyrate dehydrogenase-like beta-hydroxyacid dehydrogenase
MRIGFIGIGIMGSLMAGNLLKKRYELVIYNRTKGKAEPLIEKGALWANSSAEVSTHVDILFTMLSTPDVVYQMSLGKNGFLPNLNKNSLWVDCSTVNPSFSKKMGHRSKEMGIRFIDAPVTGTKVHAETGQLVFLAGGEKEDLEECRPLLESMGKAVLHVGDNGKGSSMKMVINLLLAESMLAFSEAMTLGESLGISKDTLFNTLLGGRVTPPFISEKRSKFEDDDYEPEFPLKWMHKDLQLIATTAYENDIALPSANIVKEIYGFAKRNGYVEKDYSAVYHLLSSKFDLID